MLKGHSGLTAGVLVQENTHELGQTRERATLLAQQVEGLGAEVREREAALRQREPLLAAAQAAADARQQALDEEAEKLQRERSRRQRLEERTRQGPAKRHEDVDSMMQPKV